jgi:acyl-CoA synthetase (AMP-forming)/AMP-acid ligase II
MEFKVGHQETFKRSFTQEDFDRFADLSGDNNPIHVDPEFSAHTHFGRTVAHGMLLYSTICRVLSTQYPGIGSWLVKREFLTPAKEAVVDGDKRLSYRELNHRVNRLSHALLGLGLRHGDRMAILSVNRVEFVEGIMAAAKLGLILVPLNWRLTATELAFIINDSGTETLLFDTNLAELVEGVWEKTALKHYIVIGGQDPSNAYGYETRLSAHTDREPTPEVTPDLNTPHIIMYTAGTTGQPKGAILIRGPNLLQGYWNRPEATAEAFSGDWFQTGDLARMDPDGCLYIVERKKDMFIQGRLAKYKIPKSVVFVKHLPRNAAGKVLKNVLREAHA